MSAMEVLRALTSAGGLTLAAYHYPSDYVMLTLADARTGCESPLRMCAATEERAASLLLGRIAREVIA